MPLRLVLDTNVWLDWLVFDDPGIAPIKAALASGKANIFIDPACEQELERVLAYPLAKNNLNASSQSACLAECRRAARMLEAGERKNAGARMTDEESSAAARLPACHDPDDQKFLELARACRADFLVTKDRALLVLARRKNRPVPFRIVTPTQFSAAID